MRWLMVLALAACEGGEGARTGDTGASDAPVTCPPEGRYTLAVSICEGRASAPDDDRLVWRVTGTGAEGGHCLLAPAGDDSIPWELEGPSPGIITQHNSTTSSAEQVGRWYVESAGPTLSHVLVLHDLDRRATGWSSQCEARMEDMHVLVPDHD